MNSFKLRRFFDYLDYFSLKMGDITEIEKNILQKEEWPSIISVFNTPFYLLCFNLQDEIENIEYPTYLYYSLNFNLFLLHNSQDFSTLQPVATFDSRSYGYKYKIAPSFY